MVMHTFSIFALVLAATSVCSMTAEDKVFERTLRQFSRRQCWKERNCKPNKERVCAFDEKKGNFTVFDDKCSVYKANCLRVSMFIVVQMKACDASRVFQKEYGSEFDWSAISDAFHAFPKLLHEEEETGEDYDGNGSNNANKEKQENE